MRLDERNGNLVYDFVRRVLFERRFHSFPFIWLYVLPRKGLTDELQSFAYNLLVRRSAILSQQEFDDESRDTECVPHPAKQVLANNEAREGVCGEFVEFIEY